MSGKTEAITQLRSFLKPGMTIYTVLCHRSSSGMSRSISLVIPKRCYRDEYPVDADGAVLGNAKPKRKQFLEIASLDYWAAQAMGYRIDDKHGGLRMQGCGMDMGFQLVYQLGATLWPNGTKKPHGRRNGQPDSAGGYALKHRWL